SVTTTNERLRHSELDDCRPSVACQPVAVQSVRRANRAHLWSELLANELELIMAVVDHENTVHVACGMHGDCGVRDLKMLTCDRYVSSPTTVERADQPG